MACHHGINKHHPKGFFWCEKCENVYCVSLGRLTKEETVR